MTRLLASAACALLSVLCAASGARATQSPFWLVVSDVHYSPFIHDGATSPLGEDTNDALLTSFLAEAHKVDPNPPVVIIAGDFLAHHISLGAAASTMAALAKRFDATFPRAQFVIALGNNDSGCGDYAAPIDDAFLAATAKAWAPLVDRNGAAPDFASRFAHDGGYVARLPQPGLRIVVVNDVFDSLRYDGSCANGQDGAAQTLARLQSDLRAAGPHDRNWVLMHIPPGIDAFSTVHLAHRLGIVPFLRPRSREALDAILTDPRDRVALAIAGHTHKFSYRIEGSPPGRRVPLLLVPSVSPIFDNEPSFLAATVAPDGTLSKLVETSLLDGEWQHLGDLGTLGLQAFSAPELESLQRRLADDAALRSRLSRLYSGAGPREIDRRNWRSYWCAATNFTATAFEACTGQQGLSVLTGRGVEVVLGVALAAAILCGALGFFFLRRTRRRWGA